ncbi:MAG: hypothetical protein WC916_02325 [Candidatus Woesearchaeota archaeon]
MQELLSLMDLVAHESRYDGCKWLEGYIIGFERPKNIFDIKNTRVHVWSECDGEYYFDSQHIDAVILKEKYPLNLHPSLEQFNDFSTKNTFVNYKIPYNNTIKESCGILHKIFIDHDLSKAYLSIFDFSRHTLLFRNIVALSNTRFFLIHESAMIGQELDQEYMNAWMQEDIQKYFENPSHYTVLKEQYSATSFVKVSSEISLQY